MSILNAVSVLGGLAFFLFGMHTLSSGLGKLSGGKFERALETMTSRPINGVLLGTLVTAVIQSSSATTVMVVGFVNSGMMKLTQAIGIIMGANLGTTATSWILSLANLENDNPVIQLLMPKNFALLFAFAGVIMVMFLKRGRKRDIGYLLVGFGLLMQGMQMMSDAVKPLAEMDAFRDLMLLFSDPLLGLLIGAVMTAIIQSSSASIGILQALSVTGVISFGTAIPIILGQNIGTCVTAMISSIGANKNAKRAAAVHFYFNVIGSLIFTIALYIARAMALPLLSEMVDSTKIAIFHTVFNLVSIAILLPCHKLLEKLAIATVRDKGREKDDITVLLDDRFLQAPSFAVEKCKNTAAKMAEISFGNLSNAIGMLEKYESKMVREIELAEDTVDMYEDKLGAYLVRLNETSLSVEENHTVSSILLIINDFERISDHAVNLLETSQEMYDKKIVFSDKAQIELERMIAAIREITQLTLNAYLNSDAEAASYVEPFEEVIDMMRDLMKANHIDRVRSGQCTIELGFVFNDIISNCERVSDHCSNIALAVMSGRNNSYEIHEYTKAVEKNSQFFTNQREEFKKKYYLPLK